MKNEQFAFFEDKSVTATEIADLMVAVGWGTKDDGEPSDVQRSLTTYPCIAHARDASGRLVGYASAFSDGAFSTFIGELVVHPASQGEGIGTELLNRVEQRCAGVPVYAVTFNESCEFLLKRGYRIPKRPMSVVTKRNAAS